MAKPYVFLGLQEKNGSEFRQCVGFLLVSSGSLEANKKWDKIKSCVVAG